MWSMGGKLKPGRWAWSRRRQAHLPVFSLSPMPHRGPCRLAPHLIESCRAAPCPIPPHPTPAHHAVLLHAIQLHFLPYRKASRRHLTFRDQTQFM